MAAAGAQFRDLPLTIDLEFAALGTGPSWLIGATTYAMDRFVPEVELIYQTGFDRPGGSFRVTVGAEPGESGRLVASRRRNRLRDRVKPPARRDIGARHFIDLRTDAYFNWARHVNTFVLYAAFCREQVADDLLAVIPDYMPPVLRQLYEVFGFEVHATNGVVRGREVRIGDLDHTFLETVRPELVRRIAYDFAGAIRAAGSGRRFGKVFVDRRGSRAIVNGDAIRAMLGARGFETVYPEDLSAADQMRLWIEATDVVAIHGAAMAPLQFRRPYDPPLRLVEILPVGHMTRFFRSMCHDVGGAYVGVRGQLKPGYVGALYRRDTPFLAQTLDNFTVDPRSLEVALHLVAGGTMPHGLPGEWQLAG